MPRFDYDVDDTDDQDWNEWDRLKINGFLFEELKVEVDGDLGNDWDVKKAPGADGAPATNKGYEPCKPKLTWELRTRTHWQTYRDLLAAVQPKPGKQAPPIITVVHPQLVLLKKDKFRIVKIHTLKKTGPQLLTAQFDLLEYFPAPKTIPKTTASKDRLDDDGNRLRHDYQHEDALPSKKPKPRHS